MVRVIERCFEEKIKNGNWAVRLKEMIPSYGESLIDNPGLVRRLRESTAEVLKLKNVTV